MQPPPSNHDRAVQLQLHLESPAAVPGTTNHGSPGRRRATPAAPPARSGPYGLERSQRLATERSAPGSARDGDRLDQRTREIGRRGVAAARARLVATTESGLIPAHTRGGRAA